MGFRVQGLGFRFGVLGFNVGLRHVRYGRSNPKWGGGGGVPKTRGPSWGPKRDSTTCGVYTGALTLNPKL